MRPGRAAVRSHRARDRVATSALVVSPLISGLFFGVISGLLVSAGGGVGRASAVGALVGFFMLTANAVALGIAQASTQHAALREVLTTQDTREAKAS
jgi:hypothetical protein